MPEARKSSDQADASGMVMTLKNPIWFSGSVQPGLLGSFSKPGSLPLASSFAPWSKNSSSSMPAQ
eukprot:scaffold593774_cov43-Prasinocladus_malaysianus.AAC.1